MTGKKVLYLTCFNIALWAVFIIVDLVTEISNSPFPEFPIVFLPIVGIVVYVTFKILCDRDSSFGTVLAEAGVFLGIGIAISLLINVLVEFGLWPIRQNVEGWNSFLNGIEYVLYPVFYIPANAIAIVIYGVVIAMVRAIKKLK